MATTVFTKAICDLISADVQRAGTFIIMDRSCTDGDYEDTSSAAYQELQAIVEADVSSLL